MKLTAIILAVIGVLLAAYGWWGMFTKAGQKRYDEMDGFYPPPILHHPRRRGIWWDSCETRTRRDTARIRLAV